MISLAQQKLRAIVEEVEHDELCLYDLTVTNNSCVDKTASIFDARGGLVQNNNVLFEEKSLFQDPALPNGNGFQSYTYNCKTQKMYVSLTSGGGATAFVHEVNPDGSFVVPGNTIGLTSGSFYLYYSTSMDRYYLISPQLDSVDNTFGGLESNVISGPSGIMSVRSFAFDESRKRALCIGENGLNNDLALFDLDTRTNVATSTFANAKSFNAIFHTGLDAYLHVDGTDIKVLDPDTLAPTTVLNIGSGLQSAIREDFNDGGYYITYINAGETFLAKYDITHQLVKVVRLLTGVGDDDGYTTLNLDDYGNVYVAIGGVNFVTNKVDIYNDRLRLIKSINYADIVFPTPPYAPGTNLSINPFIAPGFDLPYCDTKIYDPINGNMFWGWNTSDSLGGAVQARTNVSHVGSLDNLDYSSSSQEYSFVNVDFNTSPICISHIKMLFSDEVQLNNVLQYIKQRSTGAFNRVVVQPRAYISATDKTETIVDIWFPTSLIIDVKHRFQMLINSGSTVKFLFYYKQVGPSTLFKDRFIEIIPSKNESR